MTQQCLMYSIIIGAVKDKPIRIKEADKMPYNRWLAYMRLSLITHDVTNTHSISQRQNGESWLVPHNISLEKHLKTKNHEK